MARPGRAEELLEERVESLARSWTPGGTSARHRDGACRVEGLRDAGPCAAAAEILSQSPGLRPLSSAPGQEFFSRPRLAPPLPMVTAMVPAAATVPTMPV